MKTDDLWFRGFPATWNVVVLYLFVLRPPWMLSAVVLLASGRDDVRARSCSCIRSGWSKLRGLTIAMSIAWVALAATAVAMNLAPPPWVGWGLIATAAYFLSLPLLAPFALGAGLSRVRRKCPKRLARRIKFLV